MTPVTQPNTMLSRLKLFFTLYDNRFEDLQSHNWRSTVYRDFSAGLVVALTAIPMAMGFAMAMGLRPEQGIIAGALACICRAHFWWFKVSGVWPHCGIHTGYCQYNF
jgi:SulP family sulfate permease